VIGLAVIECRAMSRRDNPHNFPDASNRFQVYGFRKGANALIEVIDDTTKTGVLMDPLSAMDVAASIITELKRVMLEVVDEMDGGTVPEWNRFIGELGPHGEGTAERN
jgi:hypothetical protein